MQRIRLTDHPHARGENASLGSISPTGLGPSPRAWGKRLERQFRPLLLRTIPTRVGEPIWLLAAEAATADHPHARGENAGTAIFRIWPFGPSPRAWGKRIASRPE